MAAIAGLPFDPFFRQVLRRGKIMFHQQRRQGDHVGQIVETVGDIVRGKLARVDRQSEQIPNRVAVINLCQPTDRHATRIGDVSQQGIHPGIKPVNQRLTVCLRQRDSRIGGRHRLRPQPLGNRFQRFRFA